MIVPSLPAIRSLLSHRFPRVFGSNSQANSKHQYERSKSNSHSFKLSALSKTKVQGGSERCRSSDTDYFRNSKLGFGHVGNSSFHTGTQTGTVDSDIERAGGNEGILVRTTSVVAGVAESTASPKTWYDPSSSRESLRGTERKMEDNCMILPS